MLGSIGTAVHGGWRCAFCRGIAVMTAALLSVAIGCGGRVSTADWSASDFHQAGIEALRAGDDGVAETYFKQALQKEARNPATHYYLAVIYAEKGKEEIALVGFQRAIELEPNFPEAYYNLGTLYLNRGEAVSSIQHLERAIYYRPDYTEAFVNLGKAYFLARLPAMAGAAFEEALRLDPKNRPALENLSTLARAAGKTDLEAEYRKRLDAQNP
jgi:Tfp pilus assembly protein PilF